MASGGIAEIPPPNKNATETTKSSILLTQAEERGHLVDEYFSNTKLLQVIQDFMTNLAARYKTQLRLPANPYPELLQTMRMHELRQEFALQTDLVDTSLELSALREQNSASPQFQVCSVEHEQFALPIWGTQSTLELLTAKHLHGLLELVQSSFQGLLFHKEFTDDECQVTAYGALVGDSIFGSRAGDLPQYAIDMETHVFVVGAQLEKSMAVYARFLLKQLHEAMTAAVKFAAQTPENAGDYYGCVACDGISITALSSAGSDVQSSLWTMKRVIDDRVSFVNAIKTALVTNSHITLSRYQCTSIRSTEEKYLCQLEQAFFFHFTSTSGGKISITKNSISRRSFITGSRALTSGIFFDPQGATEIMAHFQMEVQLRQQEESHQKQKSQSATITESMPAAKESKPIPGFLGIFHNIIEDLRRLNFPKEKLRQQVSLLVESFAFQLGVLVAAQEVVEKYLRRPKLTYVMAVMAQKSFASLNIRMKHILEDICLVPAMSVMIPVDMMLSHLHRRVQDTSSLTDEYQINDFVEAISRLNEMLCIVVRVAFEDFFRLAQSTSNLTVLQAENDQTPLDEIDVLQALELAAEERRYPSTILSEAVFAQAVVDSCLDIALESAVMNTVAIHLPPNPFIDMSKHLQVFALRQLDWQQDIQPTAPKTITKIVRLGSTPLFALEGKSLLTFNPNLLHIVASEQVTNLLRWLKQHRILHDGSFRPHKSSYSVGIFPTIILYHPLNFSQEEKDNQVPLLQEADIIENYVVEGSEYDQARTFFAEAVRKDLRRIAAMRGCPNDGTRTCWHMRVEANILDPHDHTITTLDLSSSTLDDSVEKIISETAQTQCLVQIMAELAEARTREGSNFLAIHKISKTYAFHHQSTADPKHAVRLSPLISFRIMEYGIFLSKEQAFLCTKNMQEDNLGNEAISYDTSIPREEWTPHSALALQYGDLLHMYELDFTHQHSTCALFQDDFERISRLVKHSAILQLFSLEQALTWLLDSLKNEPHSTLLPFRKEESSCLSPATTSAIYHNMVIQIATQIEQLVMPLNRQLCYIHPLSVHLAVFRTRIDRWQTIQPLAEEHLEGLFHQQHHTPTDPTLTPREDPNTVSADILASLRATWAQVVVFRHSYQHAFFATAQNKNLNTQ